MRLVLCRDGEMSEQLVEQPGGAAEDRDDRDRSSVPAVFGSNSGTTEVVGVAAVVVTGTDELVAVPADTRSGA